MKNILLLTLLFSFISLNAHAESFKATTFEDQFEKKQTLDLTTKYVIFSHSKEGGNWVKEAIETSKFDQESLAAKNILYVADIHKMPSLISRFIAIPRMKDYEFPVALDKEGELTQAWAKKEDTVSVYQLNKLKVEKVSYYSDTENLTKWLLAF